MAGLNILKVKIEMDEPPKLLEVICSPLQKEEKISFEEVIR
jgi:hypothetical protein